MREKKKTYKKSSSGTALLLPRLFRREVPKNTANVPYVHPVVLPQSLVLRVLVLLFPAVHNYIEAPRRVWTSKDAHHDWATNYLGLKVVKSAMTNFPHSQMVQRRNGIATVISYDRFCHLNSCTTTPCRINFGSWTGLSSAGSKCWPKAGHTGFRRWMISMDCGTIAEPPHVAGRLKLKNRAVYAGSIERRKEEWLEIKNRRELNVSPFAQLVPQASEN